MKQRRARSTIMNCLNLKKCKSYWLNIVRKSMITLNMLCSLISQQCGENVEPLIYMLQSHFGLYLLKVVYSLNQTKIKIDHLHLRLQIWKNTIRYWRRLRVYSTYKLLQPLVDKNLDSYSLEELAFMYQQNSESR